MIQAALSDQAVGVETSGERRGSPRFQLVLPLSIRKFPSSGDAPEFFGKTIDISGRAIHFVTDAPLTPGTRLALAIDFPCKKDSSAPAVGHARVCVVRSEKVWHEGKGRLRVAAKIEYYRL